MMEDVQNQLDERGIAIDQVGVSDVRYPIVVLDRAHQRQQSVARLAISVNLPHQFKGTHMSRFIEVLNAHRGEVTMRTLPAMLCDVKQRLHAQSARIEVSFPYFLERTAPASGVQALLDYDCAFMGEVNGHGADFIPAEGGSRSFLLSVTVPVTSLCPCSKAISDYGAHNQRGQVTMEVRSVLGADGKPSMIWIEELVEIAERAASAPVYPLLKRPDERHVTMQAFDNPRFVEDIVRDVALRLRNDPRVAWFRVQVVNNESIHNHSSFARVEWARVGEGQSDGGRARRVQSR